MKPWCRCFLVQIDLFSHSQPYNQCYKFNMMFIKDIETVPQSAFKAATWRIFNFIHQANIFMHWFLATKRHPTNAKFCQITPDGQLLP